jgi:hypothetical protein
MERLRSGETWEGEFTVRRKDGSTFPAYVIDSLIHDSRGREIGIVGVSTDITERKREEEERDRLRVREIEVRSQREERRRIARDLHDVVLQDLAGALQSLRLTHLQGARGSALDLEEELQAKHLALASEEPRGVLGAVGQEAAVRVAAGDARLGVDREVGAVGLPELAGGIPSALDAALLHQYVGLSLAKEMILTGELYPVERLTATGLCNEVVGHDDVDAAIDRLVARVAGHSPPAVAAQKRLFETWQNVGLRAGVEQSIGAFAEVFAHPETLDAVSRPGSRG